MLQGTSCIPSLWINPGKIGKSKAQASQLCASAPRTNHYLGRGHSAFGWSPESSLGSKFSPHLWFSWSSLCWPCHHSACLSRRSSNTPAQFPLLHHTMYVANCTRFLYYSRSTRCSLGQQRGIRMVHRTSPQSTRLRPADQNAVPKLILYTQHLDWHESKRWWECSRRRLSLHEVSNDTSRLGPSGHQTSGRNWSSLRQ